MKVLTQSKYGRPVEGHLKVSRNRGSRLVIANEEAGQHPLVTMHITAVEGEWQAQPYSMVCHAVQLAK